MEKPPIRIAPAKDIYELLENQAVYKALEFSFREKGDEFEALLTNDEYAVFVRAYWIMAMKFSSIWSAKECVVTTSA